MRLKTPSSWIEDSPTAAAFDLGPEALAGLIGPLSSADDALARLDDRLAASPVRAGCLARLDVAEACAALWAEGELILPEDLVLHDAGMDVRSPTHELTRAQAYLRLRRRAARDDPRILLSPNGLLRLAGRAPGADQPGPCAQERAGEGGEAEAYAREGREDDGAEEGEEGRLRDLDAAFSALAVATQAAADALVRSKAPVQRDPILYEEPFDEARNLARFCAAVAAADALPPLLGALVWARLWRDAEPIQRQAQLAPLLAGIYLRKRGRTRAHLACIHLGQRALRPKRRTGLTLTEQLRQDLAGVEAGARDLLRQHDRLLLAKELLAQKGRGRRESSSLPRLATLLLESPFVTIPLIAQRLKISPQAAQILVADLSPALREITGRKRYRAWTIG